MSKVHRRIQKDKLKLLRRAATVRSEMRALYSQSFVICATLSRLSSTQFGLPLLQAETVDPGAPGQFEQAPVFRSLADSEASCALHTGAWFIDTTRRLRQHGLPYPLRIALGLADGAIEQAKQELAVWFAGGTLPTGGKNDPALETGRVAFAWKAIRYDASPLVSIGCLLRLVQEAEYHNDKDLGTAAWSALCRLNMVELHDACGDELFDVIRTGADLAQPTSHWRMSFTKRWATVQNQRLDPVCQARFLCSPNEAGVGI